MAESLFQKYGMVVDSGKEIFQENETGELMYIIQDGNVRISKLIDEKHHTLAVLGKGEFFGEMALVTRVKRTATATAVGTVRMLSFDRDGFLSMIANDARIALNIIDKLCRRLQAANSQIQVLANRNEQGRIILNLYYAFAGGANLDLHRTTREMSANLDIAQDRIMELLRKLEEAGIISVGENTLVLRNRDRFTSIAQSVGTVKARI